MTGGARSEDAESRSLDSALAELGRGLEAVRERLLRRERLVVGAPAVGSARSAPPDEEDDALVLVQDVLSIPVSGLLPHELFTLATERVARLLDADRVMLFVAEGDALRPRSARGFRRDDLTSIVVAPDEGIVGRAFRDRRVLIHGAAAAPDSFVERFPVSDAIAVPVRAEDEPVGVLYAGRRGPGRGFGGQDVLLLLVVADRVGSAIAHQALVDRRGVHVARLGELADFAAEAPLGRDVTDVLGRACEVGCRLLGVRAAVAAIGAEDLEPLASRGLPRGTSAGGPVSRRHGLTAELYASERPVSCRDVQARRASERSFLAEAGFRGCLLLPLRLRGLVLGVLYLADTEVRDFTSDDIEVGVVLAAITAVAVDNGRVHATHAGALEAARAGQGEAADVEMARVLGEMASGLAGEFSQVFAVILGKSQLLLARSPEESVREGLGVIEESAWRGADIVHRIVALAGPATEAGAATDLKALAHEALALARTRWPAEGQGRIEVVTDFEPVPPVRGGEGALREVVGHLIRNAVDAMPRGGRLGVTLRERDGGVELEVEDTGGGIPEDARAHVFDPFFTTRSPGRLGLGLTVVRSAVTRCGGRVEVTGSPGRGTTATVWLPASTGASSGPIPAAPVAEPVGSTGSGPSETSRALPADPPTPKEHGTILVLEDEEALRELLVDALARAGHDVHSAVDGATGLAKVEAGRFDVVLADLALPQRSGLVVARAVKRMSPGTRVVLITGWGHLLDPERLREHGVDLMLVKPFRPERVVSVVKDALRLAGPP